MKRRKARKLMKSLVAVLGTLVAMPGVAEATTFGQVTAATFGIGGPGIAIIQLLLISIVAWLGMYVSSAVGHGQVAGMIKVTSTFACIGIIASLAWSLIRTVCAFAGITF